MHNRNYESQKEKLEEAVENLIAKSHSAKDLRMATNALNDLTLAIETLAPYQGQPKATIFGSARLEEGSPGYQTAYEVAGLLSESGYIVITGGGPGVMHAGLKGAKEGRGVGIAIELPFEVVNRETEKANGWPLARQQMFFTRKLALIRNVQAFIAAPGGFGTLDEFFEVITLIQTGKAKPAPIVLLETADNPMWSKMESFIKEHLESNCLIEPIDNILYHVTTDPVEAVEYINNFWSNYLGLSADQSLISLQYKYPFSDATLAKISAQRGVLSTPLLSAVDNNLQISFEFDLRHWSDLHQIINYINEVC